LQSARAPTLAELDALAPDNLFFMMESNGHVAYVKAHVGGWQVGVHANGDAGIDTTLAAFETVLREMPRSDHRGTDAIRSRRQGDPGRP
jgi:predicted amidohydrolase YtcJ